ncbi:ABC transporter ATP-binding protein [Paenibacillus sp. FSL R7-0048]|uniref:ABC transporter ATP-binding protein n=1 Tax=Paenibacillus TaxID=44249 RepID=UPI0009D70CC0|nr:ABC transporter ATP-binding protein [Paenibacillus odorifer]
MLLKKKKYNLFDSISIAFRTNPITVVCILVFAAINGIVPFLLILMNSSFIDAAIDYVNKSTPFGDVLTPLLLIFLLIGYLQMYAVVSQILFSRVTISLRESFNTAIIQKQLSVKYEHVENEETSELLNRIVKNPGFYAINEVFRHLVDLIGILINFVAVGWLVFNLKWWLGAILFIVSIPLVLISYISHRDIYNTLRSTSDLDRKSGYIEFDVLRGRDLASERKLFGFTVYFNEKFEQYFNGAINLSKKVKFKWLAINKFSVLFIIITCIGFTFMLLTPLKTKEISLGYFISLITAIFQLQDKMAHQMSDIIGFLSRDSEYMKDLNRFVQLEDEEDAIDLQSLEKEIPIQRIETIEFKDVYFKYPGTSTYILKGMSFNIRSGMHYAVVGKNGSGKSTITKLLLGLYAPDRGEILINGISINRIKPHTLHTLFSIVYQDFAKYSLSVGENIALGDTHHFSSKEQINRTKVIEIAEYVGLKKNVEQLPQQFDTPLGKILPNGIDLSGGQWQKIALARSLMKSDTVRILDEPTAALDPLEESNLYKHYSKISSEDTTIFISHRLGSTKLADIILVIDDGQVIGCGSHKELIQDKGIYYDMFNSQKEWYYES